MILYGYYGEQNAGDDAFTLISTRLLGGTSSHPIGVYANRLPAAPLSGARPILMRRNWWGLSDRIERRRIRSHLRRDARIVVGGGSHFRHARQLDELELLLDLAPKGSHQAIGISVGPFEAKSDLDRVITLLARFDFIGVRDRVSLDRLHAAGIHDRAELTFDLAPLLPSVCPEVSFRPRQPGSSGLGVALCRVGTDTSALEHLAESVLDAARRCATDQVILLPFNGHPVKGDEAVHHQFARMLGKSIAHQVVRYDGDPRETMKIVAQLDGLIAMRLHAAVFAYITETPTLIVPYQEKSRAWAEMIGHPDDLVASLARVRTGQIEQILSRSETTQPSLPLEDAIRMARRNFEGLK